MCDMDEFGLSILGLCMVYSVIHFFIIQSKKIWDNRSSYEKFVTVFAMVSISVTFLSVMFPE